MFTTCPKCSLKLVVTAADLRVAQGYVRCGRCSNVFNALAGLSDEQQAVLAREQVPPPREAPESFERQTLTTAQSEPRAAASPEQSGSPPAQPATTPRPAGEGPAIAPREASIPDQALEFDPVTTDVSEVFVEPTDNDPTGTFESIVLRSEDIEVIGENSETHELEIDLEAVVAISAPPRQPDAANPHASDPAPAVDEAAQPAQPPQASQPVQPTPPQPPQPARPPQPSPEARSGEEAPAEAFAAELASRLHERGDRDEDAEESEQRHRLIDRGLRIGSIVLAVVLALQIVNHERASLAAVPGLHGPLTAVYAALGVPIAPHWNVHDYEVRQLGADATREPGALTVRASVKNDGKREQPLPLLRVTMQDRFGNRVAARDVPPSAYLPAGSASGADLAAGQRVDAEIAFADPGPNAVGFEIDACLKLASGRIVCANDAAPER